MLATPASAEALLAMSLSFSNSGPGLLVQDNKKTVDPRKQEFRKLSSLGNNFDFWKMRKKLKLIFGS